MIPRARNLRKLINNANLGVRQRDARFWIVRVINNIKMETLPAIPVDPKPKHKIKFGVTNRTPMGEYISDDMHQLSHLGFFD